MTLPDRLAATHAPAAVVLAEHGFWTAAHEARTDWAMLTGSLFLVIVGGGPWSADAWRTKRRARPD